MSVFQRQEKKPGALLFSALVSITLVGPLSIHLFLPALPHVRQVFATSEATAQLTFSLSMFMMAFATLAYGSFSDRFGRLPVLVTGLALFTAGAAVAVLATSIDILIVGRVLQGAGAACGLVLARVIIRDVYGADRLGKMIAYLTTAYVLGPLTAPPIGGLLIDRFGWESILIVPAAFGLIAIFISLTVIGETAPERGKKGPALIRGYGRLSGQPVFALYALTPAFGSAAFFCQGTASAYLTVEVLQRSAAEFGFWFMFGPAGYMLGNYLSGRLGNRANSSRLIVLGAFVTSLGALLLAVITIAFGLNVYGLFIPYAVLALGQGLAIPHAQAAAIEQEPALTGTASGIVVFLQFLFIALFPQILSAWSDGTANPMLIMVSVTAVLSLACGVGAVALSRHRRTMS